MLNTSPILITKLLPPRSQDVIASENISPLFSQIKEKKLTTVTAGAGYRKTTLISQAIGELNLKAVWYRLDESDEDFITFLHYLSVGIKKIYPDYGNGIGDCVGSGAFWDRRRSSRQRRPGCILCGLIRRGQSSPGRVARYKKGDARLAKFPGDQYRGLRFGRYFH